MTAKKTPKKAASKTVAARVTVFPRRQVLDPQGKAILQALHRLGFEQVREVRAGKSFDVVLDDRGEVAKILDEMATKLLSNPVVEDFTVEIQAEEDGA